MARWQQERLRWKTSTTLSLLAKSWHLRNEELGIFLRMHGLTTYDIIRWREIVTTAMENEKPVNEHSKKYFQDKIKKLEIELNEARAIIDIQKKVKKILAKSEGVNTQKKISKKSSTSLSGTRKKII